MLTMRTTKDNPLAVEEAVEAAEAVASEEAEAVASEEAEAVADALEVATEVEAVVVEDEVVSEDEVEAAVPCTRNPVASLILLAKK